MLSRVTLKMQGSLPPRTQMEQALCSEPSGQRLGVMTWEKHPHCLVRLSLE